MESLAHKNASQLKFYMLEAAKAGHESVVARLLALDPSLVNARTTGWCQTTPLHLAATNGHDGVVAQLLAFSPQLSDVRDSDGQTVLHLAAENGQDTIVARLLAHNPALIDAVTMCNRRTALQSAASQGHESTVAQLLNHSLGLVERKTALKADDNTALHIAASSGHVKGVGAALHEAATNGHDGVVAQLLAFSPQSSDVGDCGGQTALHFAAESGHDKIVARLLAHNPALIDAVTYSGNMTALHFAASGGNELTVVQLLSHSPGLIDMKTTNNDTALHIAASSGHVKVVAELLARRPSSLVDEDCMGRTPLFWAASEGHQEVVDLFPLTTDQAHRRDRYDNTLLHLVIGLKPALIQRVWEMNPDALFMANEHGCTPFDNALSSVHEWAIEYFQWKHSLWSVEEALMKLLQSDSRTIEEKVEALQRGEQRFREVVQGECERALLLSLPRDCVHLIISDYLFISDSVILGGLEPKRVRVKRAKVE